MLVLKALSMLLSYPEAEAVEALGELEAVLRAEPLLTKRQLAKLQPLIEALRHDELLDSQASYVRLFDQTRSLSLHLFEHVYGDSRERGSALVQLGELYARHGLDPVETELPDYLPLYLEFLSTLPPREARVRLGESAHVLEALCARLAERDSVYTPIFATLLDLADKQSGETLPLHTLDDEPQTPEAMDKAWEEAAVVFGPEAAPEGQSGCGRAAAMLSRMQSGD